MPKKSASKKNSTPSVKAATQKKTSKKVKSTKSKSAKTSVAPAVRVRMFRQGLGDSFLITLDLGGTERNILIDCGTLGNTGSKVKIQDVADHIDALIGTGKLDVVIATHEHQDHLSGFKKELLVLKDRVEHVWLAWTENPSDPVAQGLAKDRRDLGKALAAVAQAAPASDVGLQVEDLLGFAGDMSKGLQFAETVNEAMEFVRTGLGAKTRYFGPGEIIEESWLPGFRIYVLGPPKDPNMLKVLGEHGSDELYGLSNSLQSAAMLLLDANRPEKLKMTSDERAAYDQELPFDMRYKEEGDEVKKKRYPAYFDDDAKWRKIEEDWLSIASDLALQLDSITNNTSLALAIERIADGKVLLFPADAQQGNWLSWHDPKMKWMVKSSTGVDTEITAHDLLKKTVFYKVGHHGSHNATASKHGLEMMPNDDLVAFIPVNRAVALTRNPKGSWKMPARTLYRRLLEKCNGQVLRSDLGWASKPTGDAAKSVESEYKDIATEAEWKKWLASQDSATKDKRVTVTDLFVEYILH